MNASSEADTSGLIFTKQSSFRKSIKIGPRNRKFSNSLREQIEGPDSSDCDDKQCKLEPIESKQNLVYSCEESSSLNSYKSSRNDEEEEEDEEISLSSETLSDDLKEDMKNLSLFDNFPNSHENIENCPTTSQTFTFPHFDQTSTSLQNYRPNYSYYTNKEDDWFVRIQMQIQNFVQYTHNFQSYSNYFQ